MLQVPCFPTDSHHDRPSVCYGFFWVEIQFTTTSSSSQQQHPVMTKRKLAETTSLQYIDTSLDFSLLSILQPYTHSKDLTHRRIQTGDLTALLHSHPRHGKPPSKLSSVIHAVTCNLFGAQHVGRSCCNQREYPQDTMQKRMNPIISYHNTEPQSP